MNIWKRVVSETQKIVSVSEKWWERRNGSLSKRCSAIHASTISPEALNLPQMANSNLCLEKNDLLEQYCSASTALTMSVRLHQPNQ